MTDPVTSTGVAAWKDERTSSRRKQVEKSNTVVSLGPLQRRPGRGETLAAHCEPVMGGFNGGIRMRRQ